ncbi:MAG: site-specific integrase [Candidatus Pacearchaeota archaeon]|nr:site-specific integrase [Candidatus Pacearchaeota archaeon]
MSKENIHNYDRRLERTLINLKKSILSEADKELLIKFHDSMFLQGLSVSKIERYLYDAYRFGLMLNADLKNATKEDIQKLVIDIEKKDWTPSSKSTFKLMIRKLYKFVEGVEEQGVYPNKVKWIKTHISKSNEKLPEELLTPEEVVSIISCADNFRDKAFISTLYETGCRISELALVKIKQIQFDVYGAKINISGKTGSRRLRVVSSSPFLQDWINNHPFNKENDCPVWISRESKKPLSYERIAYIIRKVAKKAGINKRVNPHNFRHSRATYLANHLTEAQLKEYFGWTQSSDMSAVYIHLSMKETENALLKLSGINVNEEEQKQIVNPKCPRCNTINKITSRFCDNCGLILDEKIGKDTIKADLDRQRADEVMNRLAQNPKFIELLNELK